ncbi:MAG: DUF11 domain-containing protein [Cyanobacteria bacterium J06634_5]
MGKKIYWGALSTLTLLSCLLGISGQSARAEGSNDLVSSGGDRPYLEFRTDINGGVPRRTIIKVYANAGETIDLGSSAVGIGSGANIGVINYRQPDGTAGSCGADGLIADRAQEAAGPGDGTGGTFIPCVVTVAPGDSGIWEIDFVSPDPDDRTNPPPIAGTASWTQDPTAGIIPAWDVTVRDSSGTPISGRVYANYYAFNIGGNGRSVSSLFSVLTQEGYQYSIDLNGIDPFGFIFFANRNGFFENSSGDSIFRSLQFVGANPGQLPAGYGFQNPNDPDLGIYVTHKTFINPPDPAMPGSALSPTGTTWLYSEPVAPPAPTGLAFTGIEGTVGVAGTSPLGGTLSFNSTSQNAFSITIDLNSDGLFGTGNDRTFVGRSVVGANSVFWDGLDSDGAKVPASLIPYGVRINQYSGEAHFPIIDAEQHNNGFRIRRLNTPVGPTSISEDPDNIYYNDSNTGADFTLCAAGETGADCYGGGPTPRQSLTGLDSSAGGHEFTSNFGNRRGVDTWVYYPSADVELVGGIGIREADLIVDKTVDLSVADPGNPLTYTIAVTNDGPSDEAGITLQDNVPASLTGVNWSCSITSDVAGSIANSCGDASGTGNVINTTLNLNNQAVATYTITGTLSSSASGTITNSATAIRNLDITDPDLSNNTDDAVTVINTVPPPSGTICYAVADGTDDLLVSIDINTGVEGLIGAVGVTDIEAIAHWPGTNTLYAANAGQLGTLNTATGTYSALSNFGSGSGAGGVRTFADVNSLAFNPFTGQLFGVEREVGEDLLFQIDPATGVRVANAFGPGIDYLIVGSNATTGFVDIDDIAFDPATGALYGIANDGTTGDRLVEINLADGSTTNVGGFGVGDVEGLTAFNDGILYATTGDAAPAGEEDRFYSINKASGNATEVSALTVGNDYESVACLTGGPNNIEGTVFLDPNVSGTLDGGDSGTDAATVRLYRDSNGNGQVDAGDPLLTSQSTSGGGLFNFLVAANGSFVIDVDAATLPPENSVLTTDNVEVANFGISLNVTDVNNNFGHYTDSNLVLVKRITAINGVRLTDSVDNPSDVNDNHPNWPSGTSGAGISTFLLGATDRLAEIDDEVEYTIYYLATGNNPVTNVQLCDRVPDGSTYIGDSMVLFTNSATTNLTDTPIDTDGAVFLSAGDTTAVPCPGPNADGTVLINLAPSPSQLPNSTGPGTPSNAYGFIRFRVTVD